MRGAAAVLWLPLVGACGPLSATYEVDLTAVSRCTTRGGEESCETPSGERLTQTLIVEPRDDVVMLFLGEALFVAEGGGGELRATRARVHEEVETGCRREASEVLAITPGSDSVEGTLEEESMVTGPDTRCGQTPFGDRRRYELRGTEIEGP